MIINIFVSIGNCWWISKYNNSSIFALVFDFTNVLHFCVILTCFYTLYCDKLIGIMIIENQITWTLDWSVCKLSSSINSKWNEYYCSMNVPHIDQDKFSRAQKRTATQSMVPAQLLSWVYSMGLIKDKKIEIY